MPAELDPHVPWESLSAFIAAKIGLHFPPDRFSDLQRGLIQAARDGGFDKPADYAGWLLSAPLGDTQLRVLASYLTIGETYFFREPKTFATLTERVLPQLLQRRGVEKRLRLWSAACCTGEEPYSLAIALRQAIPDWRDWHITLLATDINERFLQKASAGIYGEWSFRDPPAGLKERYFARTPDGRYALHADIKQMVSFTPLNLADDRLPSLATQTQAMDLIFCRNVLMYFTPAQARRVIGKLHQALRDDGWLITSPTESSRALQFAFEPATDSSAVLYRKKGSEPPVSAHEQPSLTELIMPESLLSQSAAAQESAPVPSEPAHAAPVSYARAARALADQGQLTAALDACNRWIAAEPLESSARYLRAVVLQELGDGKEARRALQHALYLEPRFVLALFTLGNLARSAGHHAEGRRHFAQALTLLGDEPADTPLPHADGLTAGRLREILNALLAMEAAA